jgi:hypothetical protein
LVLTSNRANAIIARTGEKKPLASAERGKKNSHETWLQAVFASAAMHSA